MDNVQVAPADLKVLRNTLLPKINNIPLEVAAKKIFLTQCGAAAPEQGSETIKRLKTCLHKILAPCSDGIFPRACLEQIVKTHFTWSVQEREALHFLRYQAQITKEPFALPSLEHLFGEKRYGEVTLVASLPPSVGDFLELTIVQALKSEKDKSTPPRI